MALQFEIDSIDGLEDGVKVLYKQHGDKFRLDVTGIDPADELKEALRKERGESKSAREKAAMLEQAQQDAERKALEANKQYETLYKTEQEAKTKTAAELQALRESIAKKDIEGHALKVASSLTKDTARAELLKKEAMAYLQHDADGVKIVGTDGASMTAEQLQAQLAKQYPFLADAVQSSGGGASGSSGKVAANQVLSRAEFDAKNPAEKSAFMSKGGTLQD